MVIQNISFFEASQKFPKIRSGEDRRPAFPQNEFPALPSRHEDLNQQIDVQDRSYLLPRSQSQTPRYPVTPKKRKPDETVPGYDHEAIKECLFPQATRTKSHTKLTQMREKEITQQPDTNKIIQNIFNYLSQSADVKQTKKSFIEAIQQFDPTLNSTSTYRNPFSKKPNAHAHSSVEY